MTWTPGATQSSAATPRTVGFCHRAAVRICRKNSEEFSASRSMTIKSVLPSANSALAFEGYGQTVVAIEKSWSTPSMVLNTAGSGVTSKHSKAISEVIRHPSVLGCSLHLAFQILGPTQRHYLHVVREA